MTNAQASSTIVDQESKHTLAGQQAMAKSNKPGNHEIVGRDPIAAALKQMHDAVASEALPDEFLRLLDEIDTKIAAKNAAQ